MADFWLDKLQGYVRELSMGGMTSAAVQKTESRCSKFLDFCRNRKSLPASAAPSPGMIEAYAVELRRNWEAQSTIITKISTSIAFCRWVAKSEAMTDESVNTYDRLNAKRIVQALSAHHANGS